MNNYRFKSFSELRDYWSLENHTAYQRASKAWLLKKSKKDAHVVKVHTKPKTNSRMYHYLMGYTTDDSLSGLEFQALPYISLTHYHARRYSLANLILLAFTNLTLLSCKTLLTWTSTCLPSPDQWPSTTASLILQVQVELLPKRGVRSL